MLKQLTDEIYRLTLPHLRQTVNSYLIKGPKGFTVLDTGPRPEEVRNAWQKLISDGLTIEKVVVTHGHTDHIGQAAWFQQQLRVPVIFTGIGFAELKESRRKYMEAAAGASDPFVFFAQHGGPVSPLSNLFEHRVHDYFEPDDVYEAGGFVTLGHRQYQAIWTPGHARDHFCFWNEDQRILFTGDQVLGHLSPVVPTWTEEDGNPLKDYLESLQNLELYTPQLALPGHGEPIPDLQLRIAEIRQGHLHRLEQITDILKKGERTAEQITLEIYGSKGHGLMGALQLSSTISRLIYMRETGDISGELKDDGIYYYSYTQKRDE